MLPVSQLRCGDNLARPAQPAQPAVAKTVVVKQAVQLGSPRLSSSQSSAVRYGDLLPVSTYDLAERRRAPPRVRFSGVNLISLNLLPVRQQHARPMRLLVPQELRGNRQQTQTGGLFSRLSFHTQRIGQQFPSYLIPAANSDHLRAPTVRRQYRVVQAAPSRPSLSCRRLSRSSRHRC